MSCDKEDCQINEHMLQKPIFVLHRRQLISMSIRDYIAMMLEVAKTGDVELATMVTPVTQEQVSRTLAMINQAKARLN